MNNEKIEHLETDHKHCPFGHEHPQPLKLSDGREICQACLFKDDALVEMIACTPDTCK